MVDKLTANYQRRKKCKDGKLRNFITYYLNNIPILTLKVPYESNWSWGYQQHTDFREEYVKGNTLYITKEKFGKVRNCKYPISKKILEKARENGRSMDKK